MLVLCGAGYDVLFACLSAQVLSAARLPLLLLSFPPLALLLLTARCAIPYLGTHDHSVDGDDDGSLRALSMTNPPTEYSALGSR